MSVTRAQLIQMLGSLAVALAIVAVVVVAVTAQLGPTSVAELEARENARDARLDALEERLRAREDRLEELEERLRERQGGG